MRKPLIAANWKMYKTPAQAQEFVKNFLPFVAGNNRDEVVLCPSFTSLSTVITAVAGSAIAVGAQNMHFAEEGAFTGEVSPLMLKAVGVLLLVSNTNTWFGTSVVSETMTLLPSGATARTLPGVEGNSSTPLAATFRICRPAVPNSPKSVPMYAVVP